MKSFLIILFGAVLGFSSLTQAGSGANSCAGTTTQGGVDIWPWWVAQPFPWDNIEGYWKLGDDGLSYLSAHVLSSTKNRKILSLAVLGEGLCSKPYAKGTGYIDATEKNVVRALVSDGTYKYQLKLALFDSRDVVGFNDCNQNIMGASMQIIGRARNPRDRKPLPMDPGITEMQSMMLKKVTIDVIDACKRVTD